MLCARWFVTNCTEPTRIRASKVVRSDKNERMTEREKKSLILLELVGVTGRGEDCLLL